MRVFNREQDDGNHLKHRLELAEHARRDNDALACRHHAHARYDELAREDDEHDPSGQVAELDQRDERGGNQDLVGQGIHELAEIGNFVA